MQEKLENNIPPKLKLEKSFNLSLIENYFEAKIWIFTTDTLL